MTYFYIARCKDKSLYCGSSRDPHVRIKKHNVGKGSKWIKQHGQAEVIYVEEFATNIEARRREAQVKRWTRKKKENLIKGKKP